MPLRKSTGRVATGRALHPTGRSCESLHHPQHSREPPHIRAAFDPHHDPSHLDRDRWQRRSLRHLRLLRCHHDRYEHGHLVRRQRQLAVPRSLAPGKEMLRADLMPPRNLRHDCARCIRFRDDPSLILVAPPPPATDATANLDASARRGSVNYMVDHICEPILSTPFASSELGRPPQDGGKTPLTENFWSPGQKDFCNNICHEPTCGVASGETDLRGCLAHLS